MNNIKPGDLVMYNGYIQSVFMVGQNMAYLRMEINVDNKITFKYELVSIKNIALIAPRVSAVLPQE